MFHFNALEETLKVYYATFLQQSESESFIAK